MDKEKILKTIKNELVISVQATKNEPLYNESAMNALIDTVITLGHARGVRLAGARDIKNTRRKYKDVVIIGITKPDKIPENYKELVYITPNVEEAKKVIGAGADIVAFDSTTRNKFAPEIAALIKAKGKIPMGDISNFEDAVYAKNSGCEIISTTLSGYTKETEHLPQTPDFELLEKCAKELNLPVIMEGKVWAPIEVKKAFELGAHSVVIGSAITRPQKIIEKFKEGLI